MQMMGQARLEHVKAGAVLYYVNGHTMSDKVEVICISKRWEIEKYKEYGKPASDPYFEFHPGKSLKKGHKVDRMYFGDCGIDTRFGPAESRPDPMRPEAKNILFVSWFAAQQYIQRLKGLYPDARNTTMIYRGEVKKK